MVVAVVNGERREVKDLDDLVEVTELSRLEHRSLVLIGDRDQELEIPPSTSTDSVVHSAKRRAAFDAAFGVSSDLRSAEEVDNSLREGRSSRLGGWSDEHFDSPDTP